MNLPKHRLLLSEPPTAGGWRLPEDRAHYLSRVLRLRQGDQLVVFDGSGQEWLARLAGGKPAMLNLVEALPERTTCGLSMRLLQAVARGDRMDYVLQKATELGVSAIQPLISQRTEVRLDGQRAERRLSHWRGVVRHACEQSGRTRVPDVAPAMDLAAALNGGTITEPLRIILAPGGAAWSDLKTETPTGLAILVGPEGGFTENEHALATQRGFRSTGLGPRVLRTETAGPAAIAVAQARWGDIQ